MSSKTFIGKTAGLGLVGKLFDKPKQPDLPQEQEPIEEVSTVTQDAAKAQQRKKRGIRQGGSQSTVLSGINQALKKRLGE
jgi:hypothetical protein